LAPHGAKDPFAGVAIASGINAKVAHVDTYLSAVLSIDEAVRNLVSSGGDPDMTCLVDNFCWPDPLPGKNNPDHAHKMAQLVRSCAALYDVATAWGMPFVSGKDSMKNDFTGLGPDGRRVKISVPPTVLITAMARVPDVRRLVGSDFKGPDELIFVVGPDQDWPIHGSEFDGEFSFDHMSSDLTVPIDFPELDFMRIADIYRRVHDVLNAGLLRSIHDVSDGGLFASIAESAIGGRRGVRLTAIPRTCREDAFETDRWLASLFHEGPGRFVVSIKENHREEFLSRFSGLEMCVTEIGHTTIDELSGVQTAGDSAEIWLDPLAQGVALADLTSWWRNAL
jgi:phosphoribosylformylglycinamidine synthase